MTDRLECGADFGNCSMKQNYFRILLIVTELRILDN